MFGLPEPPVGALPGRRGAGAGYLPWGRVLTAPNGATTSPGGSRSAALPYVGFSCLRLASLRARLGGETPQVVAAMHAPLFVVVTKVTASKGDDCPPVVTVGVLIGHRFQ